MVVCIHSNVYYLHNASDECHWLAVMIMTALCVVSVPLFFMVSGAGNLVKDNLTSVTELFKVKIPKVFIPFAVWSIIYVCLRIATGKTDASVLPFVSLLWEPAYYQFWFMYSLLGMYLCLPIFQYLVIKSSKSLLQYILIFWIVSSLVLPMLVRYIPEFKLSEHFNLIFLEGYWGYFVLGGYLRKYPINNSSRKGLWLLLIGMIVTLSSAIIEWHLTPVDRYYGYVYCAYLLPGAAMMTAGAFLALQGVRIQDNYRKIIIYLSGLTMGVFYIHLIVINSFEIVFKDQAPTFINAVVKLLIVVIISFAACAILRQIKPLRKFLL